MHGPSHAQPPVAGSWRRPQRQAGKQLSDRFTASMACQERFVTALTHTLKGALVACVPLLRFPSCVGADQAPRGLQTHCRPRPAPSGMCTLCCTTPALKVQSRLPRGIRHSLQAAASTHSAVSMAGCTHGQMAVLLASNHSKHEAQQACPRTGVRCWEGPAYQPGGPALLGIHNVFNTRG